MKKVHKNLFNSYILSDQVWCRNIKLFLSYSKNYTGKFMQASSWHHKLFHFHLFIWIWKVWKGRGKITKEYLKNEKSFLDEIKNIFHSFWRVIIWWNNKNFIKNSGHKLEIAIQKYGHFAAIHTLSTSKNKGMSTDQTIRTKQSLLTSTRHGKAQL